MSNYYVPTGGLPPQSQIMTDRSVFTDAYAVIPKGTLSDITASRLPFWDGTRAWILARPLTGFAETFSHYVVEVEAGGGSERPDDDTEAQTALFVTKGTITVRCGGDTHSLDAGGFAYLPAGAQWSLQNDDKSTACFHWIRKRYQSVEGIKPPSPLFAKEADIKPTPMKGTDAWATTLFTDPADMAHDMAVTIVTFQPGGSIPFAETHVMEHGLYVLQGKAVYRLNDDWVEVEAGDYMWLRAFCPQACVAAGPEPFRYLLYKDINRHAPLGGHL